MNIEDMECAIRESFEQLFGEELSFDPDEQLLHYVRGKPLTVGELRSLQADSVVFVTYRENGENEYRINGAMRLIPSEENYWVLEDGSSFMADFEPVANEDDALCLDVACGEGEMLIYEAVATR